MGMMCSRRCQIVGRWQRLSQIDRGNDEGMLRTKENGLQDGILQAVAHMYAEIKIDLALDDETIC